MKGSNEATIEMMEWYDDYQNTELEIRHRARRNRKDDHIYDIRRNEFLRKSIGYLMLACVILLVGSIGSIEVSETVPTGSVWICVLSQVILYTLIFIQIKEAN